MASSAGRTLVEHLKALAISFGAVALAMTQFVRHAPASPDIVATFPLVVAIVVTLLVVVPALAIFTVDRVLWIRDASGGAVKRLRTAVYTVAVLMIGRQLFLYFDPVNSALSPLSSNALTAAIGGLAILIVAVWIARKAYDAWSQFFLWMAAPAAFMMLVVAGQVSVSPPSSGYAAETPVPFGDAAPVFILVFDELSYDVLSAGDSIDADSYPNLSTLAADGAWFTNATTNYFHTKYVVPQLFEAAEALKGSHQVRLYSNYREVESTFYAGCGKEYTCRGAAHLAVNNVEKVTGDFVTRVAYQVVPGVGRPLLSVVSKPITRALDTVPPDVDRLGVHLFSQDQWSEFMADVEGGPVRSRLYFVHVLLPHAPFIYDAHGKVADSAKNTGFHTESVDEAATYERYRQQTRYVDSLVGDLISLLKSEGLYDASTVVVTGDHGLRREVGGPIEIDGETAQVPMIIKSPTVTPQVVRVDYQHVDFVATVLDVLGRDIPTSVPGVSAFAEERPDRNKVLYIDSYNKRYWEYILGATGWELVREVEGPLPEVPQLAAAPAAFE